MATQFSVVFKRFLNKITDSTLAKLLPDTLDSIMVEYLQSSIVRFRKCKQNIKDFDLDLLQFNFDLSMEEIEILSLWMVYEWSNQQINRIELFKQTLSSSEYASYSQANHLQALLAAKEASSRDVYLLMKYYSYDNNDLSKLSNRNGN